MRKALFGLMIAVVATTVQGVWAAEAATDAVAPGKWTMDLDAARKMAGEKKLPILLDFSGSDWCGWCKLMEKNVFTEQKWKDYAKDSIMMVLIDFPKDTSIVPEKYVKRNAALQEKYGVKGFPTFIVLDDDGEKVLGQLGASEGKTPESFINELESLFRYRPGSVAKYTKSFKAADRDVYVKIIGDMNDCKKAIEEQKKQFEGAAKKIEDLQKKAVSLQDAAMDFRASRLDSTQQTEYKDLKVKMDSARKKLTDWLETKPPRTEENGRKYKEMTAEIEVLGSKLSQY